MHVMSTPRFHAVRDGMNSDDFYEPVGVTFSQLHNATLNKSKIVTSPNMNKHAMFQLQGGETNFGF